MERSPLTVTPARIDVLAPPSESLPQSTFQSAPVEPDPEVVMTSCANCGARMLDRKCKLICACGYFLSCSDYY